MSSPSTSAMSLSKDLVFLILQFLNDENLKRTAHMLEQETGHFFDLKYFGDLLLDGNWEEAERYLSSFTGVKDNRYSTKIYFEIRKQKYLEALDRHDHAVALEILHKDLKVFAESNKELYKEMAQLLALDDFREHGLLAAYTDTLSARKKLITEVSTVIQANPIMKGKTTLPQIKQSRLKRLINQSLNWQHMNCTYRHSEPHIDSLFTDHSCPGPDYVLDQLNNETTPPQNPVTASTSPCIAFSAFNQSPVDEPMIPTRDVSLGNLSNKALKDSQNCLDTSDLNSTNRVDKVAARANSPRHLANELPKDFPGTVERTLKLDSSPTSMDFHPVHQTLLLVGNDVGDVELWDIICCEQLFKGQLFWGGNTVLGLLPGDVQKISSISVNRILWSPDGSLFGVAYSKRIIRLYSYQKNGNYCEGILEIDAHVGSVNDLVFYEPNRSLVAISCGDDKLIQVWDATTGANLFTFEGHGAPVYSVCPHVKETIHFVFSISINGEIKAWLFDNMGARVTYEAPGFCCMRMAYSADGRRLFSCGTNEQGESYMIEWNESEGSIVRNYNGLSKNSSSIVQFVPTRNRFLAAGDDHLIKIWDVDSSEILAVIDAGLPARPYLCFNKKDNLLAVSAENNQIKILANDEGGELFETSAIVSDDSSGCLNEYTNKLAAANPISDPPTEECVSKEETLVASLSIRPKWFPEPVRIEMPITAKIVEVSHCQSVLLTSEVETNLIRRLVYTNAGNGILALAEGIHLLWKWVKSGANLSDEATTKFAPQLWKPKSQSLMINDLPENNLDMVTPCFSLSKNDGYLVSASGRIVTLYNMLTFKKMKSLKPSPPAATCIAFYPPDNNLIALGMDDASILIYNIREDKLISKLQGHSRRISGLAFSTSFNLLVSSGVDTQIVLWDCGTWERKKHTMLQISIDWFASDVSETNIELEKDQKHFLVVHETQLAKYETTTLQCQKQWAMAKFCTWISHATFSCDSQLVYAVMRDGILLILGASDLTPRFEIDPSAYLPPRIRSCAYPVVVAAHPKKPNQFALGLSNGRVVVIEPAELEGKWMAPSHKFRI